MSKLNPADEHPLDVIIFDAVHRICPFLRNTKHTPNVITTYSFVCGLLSLYALWTGPGNFSQQRETGPVSVTCCCLHYCMH